MRKLTSLLNLIDNISEWSGRGVSFLIVIITAQMAYEVVARYVFRAPTLWSFELTFMLCGAYGILGGAYVLRHAAHVNVDLIYGRLSQRGKARLDVLSAGIFFLFVGILVWKGWELGWTSVQNLERTYSLWEPPIYYLKMTLPIGGGLIFLQGLSKFIRDLNMAITGSEMK